MCYCSCSFASLASLRFLVIDEADKLLDYHFNQWLPKLLHAVAVDKATPTRRGMGKLSLASAMQGMCGNVQRLRLLGTTIPDGLAKAKVSSTV